MPNNKYFEVGWIKLYMYIGGTVIALVVGGVAMAAHAESKEKHMSQREVKAITEMGKDIQYNRLEITRVDGAWKQSMKEIKKDMKEGFKDMKEFIRDN